MKLLFLVNELAHLKPSQSTTELIHTACKRGHQVHVLDVTGLTLRTDRRLAARCVRLEGVPTPQQIPELLRGPTESVLLEPKDAVLVRTNPGRDPRVALQRLALELLELAEEQGVRVLNRPSRLLRSMSKLNLASLPAQCLPRTLVSADPVALREFVLASTGPVVLKPLVGTQGKGVWFLDPAAPRNLAQILESLLSEGAVMAQDRIPGAEQGDVRVIVLNGEVLQVDGKIAAVRRVPGPGEERSNVAKGGTPTAAVLTDAQLQTATTLARTLMDQGIHLAGLDLIGDAIVEANVFATGGLGDAGLFSGVDFLGPVMEGLEAYLDRS